MPKVKKSAPKSSKKKRMEDEMAKFKSGNLHSGSKDGPKVKSKAQAVAIGLSESGQSDRPGKTVTSPLNKRAIADKQKKRSKKSRNSGRT